MNGRSSHERSPTHRSGSPNRRHQSDSAFTLVEMLVAVGAVALIAVGLARVFSAAGKTVTVGNTVSRLNESAALIERQIREDLAGISRGGFMVIVNERADEYHNSDHMNDGKRIALSADDLSGGRPRRVDQLMFFAEGSFLSKRQAVAPDFVASASQARIYYGHGLKWSPSVNTEAIKIEDERETDQSGPQNSTPGFGVEGPNQFASDWTLLRHVTLLAQPSEEPRRTLSAEMGSTSDNDYQIAAQPAAPSIFRWLESPDAPRGDDLVRHADQSVQKPAFACGAVDIATTSLAEVRAVVLDAISWNTVRNTGGVWEPWLDDGFNNDEAGGAIWFANTPTANLTDPTQSLGVMKFWMKNALPTASDNLFDRRNAGFRMHCEPVPPNLLGTRNPGVRGRVNEEYERTDQIMLTASNFVPACTEFIVEWSFGLAHPPRSSGPVGGPPGEIIWHGLERWVDLNGDGEISRAGGSADRNVARPYLDYPNLAGTNLSNVENNAYALDSAVVHSNAQLYISGQHDPDDDIVPSELFHGEADLDSALPPATLYSYFGYVDPTYEGVGSRDWPWPKMLRITMSLADPNDPTTERTFQFVVELPERREAAQY